MRRPPAAPSSFARLFAHAGAVLFFLSLAYFVYAYGWAFAAPAPGGDAAGAVAWNVALFTIFALHHSVFARAGVRAWIARTRPDLERPFYVWIASLLFIAVCALWRPVPGVAWEAEGALVWGLRLLQLAGVWLTLRSAAILDVRELAGLPGSASAGRRPADEFRTVGPYGWMRHPIYTGWFLIVFAATPMTLTRLVFAVVSGAYLLLAIPLEERSLRAASAGAYERYARQVRWKLVPGLY